MQVKWTKREDGFLLRKTLIGVATSNRVCSAVATNYRQDYFAGPAGMLVKWCVTYHRKYGKAPSARLQDKFEQWAETEPSKESLAGIEKLLSQLSKFYESSDYDDDYLLHAAEEYLEKRRGELVTDYIEQHGTPPEESQYPKVKLAGSSGVDLAVDFSHIYETFNDEDNDPLIKYPGALGNFFGNTLIRGGFIAFQAPEKTGKSFLLQEMFYLCSRGRRKLNTVYLECGDLTKRDWFERLAARGLGASIDKTDDGKIYFPTEVIEDGSVTVKEKDQQMLSPAMTMRFAERFAKRAKTNIAKFYQFSAGGVSVGEIDQLIRQDMMASERSIDLIIVDYADILNHRPYGEGRDGVNGTWQALRALAMVHNCCVVTATQADAGSYNVTRQSRMNFSEDKRKYAHVSGLIGLSPFRTKTDEENNTHERVDYRRLQWLVRRKGRPTRDVVVAGCLDVSRFHCCSCFV